MKESLQELFQTTLGRIALDRVMRQKITCADRVLRVDGEAIELANFKKILVLAIGKAAVPMARTVARLLEPEVTSGIVVSPAGPEEKLRHFLHYTGGHPYPTAGSMHAASVALELLDDLKPHYLVLYLLSGGGSAICEKPVSGSISLADLREFYRLLVTCGANIVEMNVLRKHFSAVKGGRLAARAHPARQLTLFVSDVPPDEPSSVASGPTMPDASTVEDCYEIARRLQIAGRLPESIRRMFAGRAIPETPKPGDEVFSNSSWRCLLDTRDGLQALEEQARGKGWIVETDLSVDDGPLPRAVEHLLERLARLRGKNPGRTVALLSGGELSCPVTGDGVGGRNLHFVLEAARRIAGENIAVLSAGTDGIDGSSPAAGAVADGQTLERASRLRMDPAGYAQRSDSYHFFEALGDVILTGPTGNNIRDLRILVAW